MNLSKIDNALSDEILSANYEIGFYVHRREYYWIADYSENFRTNYMKTIDHFCSSENFKTAKPADLTIEEWRQSMASSFRGGIPILTEELFPKYRDNENTPVVSTDLLRQFIWSAGIEKYKTIANKMDEFMSTGRLPNQDMISDFDDLNHRLPKFYINYDRQIFIHKCHERSHETSALDGWFAEYGDFLHMIPTSHRYWTSDDGLDLGRGLNFN